MYAEVQCPWNTGSRFGANLTNNRLLPQELFKITLKLHILGLSAENRQIEYERNSREYLKNASRGTVMLPDYGSTSTRIGRLMTKVVFKPVFQSGTKVQHLF